MKNSGLSSEVNGALHSAAASQKALPEEEAPHLYSIAFLNILH